MRIKYYEKMSKNLQEELEKNVKLQEEIEKIADKENYKIFVDRGFFISDELKEFMGIQILSGFFILTDDKIILEQIKGFNKQK